MYGRTALCVIAAVFAFSVAASAALPSPAQKKFVSPEEAASALIAATKSGDLKAMLGILGSEAKSVLESGDVVADRLGRERFVKSYEEGSKLTKSGETKAMLVVGKDEWPFPIPLVKDAVGWRFDSNTLILNTGALVQNFALFSKLPYHPVRDFAAISPSRRQGCIVIYS